MKKILLATMIMGMTTGLMGCTKYQIVPVDSVKNNDTTKEQVVTENISQFNNLKYKQWV